MLGMALNAQLFRVEPYATRSEVLQCGASFAFQRRRAPHVVLKLLEGKLGQPQPVFTVTDEFGPLFGCCQAVDAGAAAPRRPQP